MSIPPDEYIGLEGTRPYAGAASFYALHRGKVSDGFVAKLVAALELGRDDRLLDLGTGPGQLALRFAPHVHEVVGLDPEQDMIEEAIVQAGALGIANARFVVGSSDDLDRMKHLGEFRAVLMGESFHWMLDRDRVLATLATMTDPNHGAVALIRTGDVVEGDPKLAVAAQAVRQVLARYLADTPPGRHPQGRYPPYSEILGRSPFSQIQTVTHDYTKTVDTDIDDLIRHHYTISHTLSRLGDRREAYETEAGAVVATLDLPAHSSTRVRDDALVGFRT